MSAYDRQASEKTEENEYKKPDKVLKKWLYSENFCVLAIGEKEIKALSKYFDKSYGKGVNGSEISVEKAMEIVKGPKK